MIRDYNINDIKRIEELGNDLKENFKINNVNENESIIVYTESNNIIAFLHYQKLYETIDILNIVVDKSFRRQGIGQKLLNYLMDNNSCEHIMLEVRESNKEAIRFYEKNGFKSIRTIKKYYNSEDGIAMERSLL